MDTDGCDKSGPAAPAAAASSMLVAPSSAATSSEVTAGEPPPLPSAGPPTSSIDPAQPPPKPDREERAFDCVSRQIMVYGVKKLKKEKAKQTVDEWVILAKERNYNVAHGTIERIKKPPTGSWMQLTLSDDAMVQPMIDFINSGTIELKGCSLRADRADSNNGKRKGDKQGDGPAAKRQCNNDVADAFISEEELKNKVIPLWKISAEEQKKLKVKEMVQKCAMKIVNEVKARFRTTNKGRDKANQLTPYAWLDRRPAILIEPIVSAPSPVRNKCELTFGYKILSEEPGSVKVPAVGFKPLGWAGGVAFSDSLAIISPEVGVLVDVFNQFLAGSSLPPYDQKTHSGFWRTVTVRTSDRTLECMLIICHTSGDHVERNRPSDSSGTTAQELVKAEKEKLVGILKSTKLTKEEANEPFLVTSIFFQEYDGASSPTLDQPVEHVYGKTVLTEALGRCKFEISPGAFFQVNTAGAELLYGIAVDKVRSVVKTPEKTVLFDVCCGTGTIGLTCMKENVVGRVVGVDISAPAIANAKRNAAINGYDPDLQDSKVRFVAERAEKALYNEIKQNLGSGLDFVALVDPARAGLHADVVKTIRSTEEIKRLVYVSCNPTGTLVHDAGLLCSPPTKKYKGTPFTIVSATPVDMFPLTDHCEMVMVFDRMDSSKAEASSSEPEVTGGLEDGPVQSTAIPESN